MYTVDIDSSEHIPIYSILFINNRCLIFFIFVDFRFLDSFIFKLIAIVGFQSSFDSWTNWICVTMNELCFDSGLYGCRYLTNNEQLTPNNSHVCFLVCCVYRCTHVHTFIHWAHLTVCVRNFLLVFSFILWSVSFDLMILPLVETLGVCSVGGSSCLNFLYLCRMELTWSIYSVSQWHISIERYMYYLRVCLYFVFILYLKFLRNFWLLLIFLSPITFSFH